MVNTCVDPAAIADWKVYDASDLGPVLNVGIT
jgi:hypothetical protein